MSSIKGKRISARRVWLLLLIGFVTGTLPANARTADFNAQESLTSVRQDPRPATGLLTINATAPSSGAVGVPTTTSITVTFSEPVEFTSLGAATFTVTNAETQKAVAGTFSTFGSTATFTPTSQFKSGTRYVVTLTKGVTDLSGAPLSSGTFWSFTTEPLEGKDIPAAPQQRPVRQSESLEVPRAL